MCILIVVYDVLLICIYGRVPFNLPLTRFTRHIESSYLVVIPSRHPCRHTSIRTLSSDLVVIPCRHTLRHTCRHTLSSYPSSFSKVRMFFIFIGLCRFRWGSWPWRVAALGTWNGKVVIPCRHTCRHTSIQTLSSYLSSYPVVIPASPVSRQGLLAPLSS